MPGNGAAARTDPPARRTARRRPNVCEIRELGHEVRLSPAVHARPYVKRQKNEKATRPVVKQAGALTAGWAACQRTGDYSWHGPELTDRMLGLGFGRIRG